MQFIKQIDSKATLNLRNELLRDSKGFEFCHFPGDDESTTYHFGLFDGDSLVGILSLFKVSNNLFCEKEQYQLRGMAISSKFAGKGGGRLLLNHAFNFLKERKVELLWCNARTSAQGFYLKNGFNNNSDIFMIPEVGEHIIMSHSLG